MSSVWLLWWCDVPGLVPEHVLQLQQGEPQQRTLFCPLLLLYHFQRQGHLLHKTLLIPFCVVWFLICCLLPVNVYLFICLLTVCVLEQMVINTMCGQSMQELEYVEAGDFIHTNGCIDKLVNWIHSNLFLLGGIALGLAIPQVGYTYQHTDTHTRTNTHILCSRF